MNVADLAELSVSFDVRAEVFEVVCEKVVHDLEGLDDDSTGRERGEEVVFRIIWVAADG